MYENCVEFVPSVSPLKIPATAASDFRGKYMYYVDTLLMWDILWISILQQMSYA